MAGKSDVSFKTQTVINGGVIDRDYRGTIKIQVLNLSDKKVTIKEGDAVAQLICEKVTIPSKVVEADISSVKTERGERDHTSDLNKD